MAAPPPKHAQFKKGNPGRRKGVKNKSTQNAREAIAHDRDGPLAAIKCFSDLIEYHVPKLARHEMTGKDEGPVELVVKWLDAKK
ncbi:MAG: hypothetical protein EBR82_61810 [Caulobacteraceae bacterium]|nr:hypothetical protein [Caulobacteraceae bacterium]